MIDTHPPTRRRWRPRRSRSTRPRRRRRSSASSTAGVHGAARAACRTPASPTAATPSRCGPPTRPGNTDATPASYTWTVSVSVGELVCAVRAEPVGERCARAHRQRDGEGARRRRRELDEPAGGAKVGGNAQAHRDGHHLGPGGTVGLPEDRQREVQPDTGQRAGDSRPARWRAALPGRRGVCPTSTAAERERERQQLDHDQPRHLRQDRGDRERQADAQPRHVHHQDVAEGRRQRWRSTAPA